MKKKKSNITEPDAENKIKTGNLIHIKFEYEESVQSKKEILDMEMSVLRIARIIRRYHTIRNEEIAKKTRLYRKIIETKTEITKLNKTLPKIKIPDILKKSELGEITKEEKEIIGEEKKHYDESLESQIKEIQEKLRELQR